MNFIQRRFFKTIKLFSFMVTLSTPHIVNAQDIHPQYNYFCIKGLEEPSGFFGDKWAENVKFEGKWMTRRQAKELWRRELFEWRIRVRDKDFDPTIFELRQYWDVGSTYFGYNDMTSSGKNEYIEYQKLELWKADLDLKEVHPQLVGGMYTPDTSRLYKPWSEWLGLSDQSENVIYFGEKMRRGSAISCWENEISLAKKVAEIASQGRENNAVYWELIDAEAKKSWSGYGRDPYIYILPDGQRIASLTVVLAIKELDIIHAREAEEKLEAMRRERYAERLRQEFEILRLRNAPREAEREKNSYNQSSSRTEQEEEEERRRRNGNAWAARQQELQREARYEESRRQARENIARRGLHPGPL